MNHGEMQHRSYSATGRTSHDHQKMMIADFKKRFFVVLLLTIPIMGLSAI